jgi:hypothetical protein
MVVEFPILLIRDGGIQPKNGVISHRAMSVRQVLLLVQMNGQNLFISHVSPASRPWLGVPLLRKVHWPAHRIGLASRRVGSAKFYSMRFAEIVRG